MKVPYIKLSSKLSSVGSKISTGTGYSRWKIGSLFLITFIVGLIIIYSCVDFQFFRTCCQKPIVTSIGSESNNFEKFKNTKIHYKHTKRRLPSCIIIGVRKGGTRALLQFLNIHPSIQAAGNEIHFFDDDDNYNMGNEWYRKKMPYSFEGQITMEKTPGYFVSNETPERVYKMNSSMKILLIMRDPVERAISDYTQIHYVKLSKGKRHPSFEQLAIDQNTGEVRRQYNAIRRSVYHRHLEKWLKYFPLNQILVLSGKKLVKDPLSVVKKVEAFLGIPHKIGPDNIFFNRTRGFFCIHNGTDEKCLSPSKGRKHVRVEEEVIEKLKDFFRPHNQKFFNILGKDFDWD